MKCSFRPPPSGAKVIAAGVTSDGDLRATVMFTPVGGEAPGELAHWPGHMFKALRDSQWQLCLSVAVMRVVDEDLVCRADTYAALCDKAKSCLGTAQGGREAFGSEAPPWLDDLWCHDFALPKAAQVSGGVQCNVWKCLSDALERSSKGKAFKADGIQDPRTTTAPPVIDQEKLSPTLVQGPSPDETKTAGVAAIVPARQSELAVILEMQRSLELCATTQAARDAKWNYTEREAACALAATGAPDGVDSGDMDTLREKAAKKAQTDLDNLWRTAAERYMNAFDQLRNHFCDVAGNGMADDPPFLPWLPASVETVIKDGIGARETIDKKLQSPLNSQLSATQPEDTTDCAYMSDFNALQESEPAKVVSQRFYAIQSSPSLSRLYGLTVDVIVGRHDLAVACGLNQPSAGPVFLLLSLDDSQWKQCDLHKIWTLAKWHATTVPGHFWPACRLEVGRDMDKPVPPSSTQYDGVVVLGQALRIDAVDAKKTVKRFELSSLDIHAASEAALDKRRRASLTKSPTSQQVQPPTLASRPPDWARKTHSTAGFTFIDRARLEVSVTQFASGNLQHGSDGNPNTKPVVLDAIDLTVGYRIDVGVAIPKPVDHCKLAWRSLMARQIAHGTHDILHNRVRSVAPLLMGGAEWAETLDDAVLGLPARVIYRPPQAGATISKVDVFVEESIATWNGEPMAAHCAGPKSVKARPMPIGAGDTFTLPTSAHGAERRPPALRFGSAYRFGIRAVYPTGVSLPLEHAKHRYETDNEAVPGLLSLPAGKGIRMRRFLRHERIDLPTLLMPRELFHTDPGMMGHERSAHAIVRSATGELSNRATPVRTRRVFAPPCVDIHFAALHGEFDREKVPAPRQGLPNVRYDARGGGFPYVTNTGEPIVGVNGHTFQPPQHVDRSGTRGDLVYELGGSERTRPVPYYPDPLARQYAVALRFAGTQVYLKACEDKATDYPICVDVYATGARYPDVRVLGITVVRSHLPRATFPPTIEDVIPHVPDRNEPAELVVNLAAGEDFEIDVWCIPSAEDLSGKFAVVESIGTVALAQAAKVVQAEAEAHASESSRGDIRMPSSRPNAEDLREALKKMLPAGVCSVIGQCAPNGSGKLRWSAEGIGGLDAPAQSALREIANALHATLQIRPLDEISAVQTLRVTHATAYPSRMPSVDGERRINTSRAVARWLREHLNEVPKTTPYLAPRADAQEVHTTQPEYMLTGDLAVDLVSTEAVDIYAATAFPNNKTFDDDKRGRGASARRHGTWPNSAKFGADSKAEANPLSTRDVYGFDVAANGVVTLPRQQILLLRIENMPAQLPGGPGPGKDGRMRLPLEWLADGRSSSVFGDARSRFIFPDRKARRLDIQVVGQARHSALMRAADGAARKGHWLIEGTDVPSLQPALCPCTEIWLDAAVRPSQPLALSPTPAFVWSTAHGGGRSRVAVVRIPLGRGWYSSGEEEQLGIVLWPPDIFDRDPVAFAKDCVYANGRKMALPAFEDDDLGPGGRFVTRWGSDPTRPPLALMAGAAPRTFVDPSAFADLRSCGPGFKATTVESAQMPVRVGAESDQDSPAALMNSASSFLAVSLVTYTPRFDIETEQWFVDAAIEHPYEHQPFLRLGLVRYQAHAPKDLRVSYPVTQWVQLLPRRDTRVNTVRTDKGKRVVEVIVEGPGDSALAPGLSAEEAASQPAMTICLVQEYTNAAGTVCRHVSAPCTMQHEARRIDGPFYGGLSVTWTGCLEVPDMPSAKSRAYIEERFPFLPASYRYEPVSPTLASDDMSNGRDDVVYAGPRFSVVVDL